MLGFLSGSDASRLRGPSEEITWAERRAPDCCDSANGQDKPSVHQTLSNDAYRGTSSNDRTIFIVSVSYKKYPHALHFHFPFVFMVPWNFYGFMAVKIAMQTTRLLVRGGGLVRGEDDGLCVC